jgi:hypothetical protein
MALFPTFEKDYITAEAAAWLPQRMAEAPHSIYLNSFNFEITLSRPKLKTQNIHESAHNASDRWNAARLTYGNIVHFIKLINQRPYNGNVHSRIS